MRVFFGLGCTKASSLKSHLSSQGSVFQIILSCRCPLSLRSLCSFSLPSLLLISIWTLSLLPAGSLMWNSAKYRFVFNVHSATFVPLYFSCLQVFVSSASGTIPILKWRHSLLCNTPFWWSLLIGFLSECPHFQTFLQGLFYILIKLSGADSGSCPDPLHLKSLASFVYFFLVRLMQS